MNMKEKGTGSLIICNLEDPGRPGVRESALDRVGNEDKLATSI
jgi:hypothetical protein